MNRDELALLLEMPQHECAIELARLLFSGKSQEMQVELIRCLEETYFYMSAFVLAKLCIASVCLHVKCDVIAVDETVRFVRDFDIRIHPFGDETCCIIVHTAPLTVRQCVQALLARYAFTIRVKSQMGENIGYSSFRWNRAMDAIYEESRQTLLQFYIDALKENGATQEELDTMIKDAFTILQKEPETPQQQNAIRHLSALETDLLYLFGEQK